VRSSFLVCGVCGCEGDAFFQREGSKLILCATCSELEGETLPGRLLQRFYRARDAHDYATVAQIDRMLAFWTRGDRDGC